MVAARLSQSRARARGRDQEDAHSTRGLGSVSVRGRSRVPKPALSGKEKQAISNGSEMGFPDALFRAGALGRPRVGG